jgi:hypothetical protein
MSAQGDAGPAPPRPDYRSARRLVLIGVLVAVASLLVLAVGGLVSAGDPGDPGDSAAPTASASGGPIPGPPGDDTDSAPDDTVGAPDDTDGAPGGPGDLAPDPFPGETADEYKWRAEADDLREQARDALQAVLDAGPATDPALRAHLERIAGILDHEAEADALRQKARAAALGSSSELTVESSGSGAGGLTTVVGLIGALGGMITAAAGLLTAWVSWRKARAG